MKKKKQWLCSDEFLDLYTTDNYFSVDMGDCEVNPSDIIALSLPYDELIKDSSTQWLREEVTKNGWKNIHTSDLHLCLLPDGKYIVGNGGNHRALISNELGINRIIASVTVFLSQKFVPVEIKNQIAELENERLNILSQIREEKKVGNTSNVQWELCGKFDSIEQKQKELLQSIVIGLELVCLSKG